jgi:hypothetical protein
VCHGVGILERHVRTRSVLIEAVIGVAFLVQSPAQAITIGFAQEVELGSPVDVPIVVSGLGDAAPPSLSSFDLDVSFDPSILAFDSVAFGDPLLGDQLDLFGSGSLTDVLPGAGTVNLFELSFDLPSDLDTLQAGSFTLATLTFDTLALGTSAIDISANALGDAFGDPLVADLPSGFVKVIPEPGSALLLAFGALAVLILRAVSHRHPIRAVLLGA